MKILIAALAVMTSLIVAGQRPSFAGTRPIGFPETPNRTTTADPLGNRFGEGTTEKLPIEANGDRDLIDRLSKLPIDKQPFWFINWQALEKHRQEPQTYPQRPNAFVDPIPLTGQGNSGISTNPPLVEANAIVNRFATTTGNPNGNFQNNSNFNQSGNLQNNPNLNPNGNVYPNGNFYPNSNVYPNGPNGNTYPNNVYPNGPNGNTYPNGNVYPNGPSGNTYPNGNVYPNGPNGNTYPNGNVYPNGPNGNIYPNGNAFTNSNPNSSVYPNGNANFNPNFYPNGNVNPNQNGNPNFYPNGNPTTNVYSNTNVYPNGSTNFQNANFNTQRNYETVTNKTGTFYQTTQNYQWNTSYLNTYTTNNIPKRSYPVYYPQTDNYANRSERQLFNY